MNMIVHADLANPWAHLSNNLVTLVPNIKVGVSGDGDGVYSMSAIEFLSLLPDPTDANLRKMELADDGNAVVMTMEVLPKAFIRDPRGLTDVLTEITDENGKRNFAWVPRCQSAEDQYRAMFTRLKADQIKTVKVKIVVGRKMTLDHLNCSDGNGKIQMHPQLKKRTIKLNKQAFSIPILTLVWRVALVDTIMMIQKPRVTVDDITAQFADQFLMAPERGDDEYESE